MSTRSLTAACAAAAVLLAGCGAGSTSPETGTAPAPSTNKEAGSGKNAASFNQADVSFARNMIPHHEQAVMMADMVAGHTDNTQLRDFAAKIRAAQRSEITTLRQWLKQWNATPSGSGHSGSGMSDMNHDMAGMMGKKDMAKLKKAHGVAFDEMWLRMMIEHHKGAVQMARTELDKGRHDGARQLARRIIDAQKAEITQMRSMLDKA